MPQAKENDVCRSQLLIAGLCAAFASGMTAVFVGVFVMGYYAGYSKAWKELNPPTDWMLPRKN